MGGVDVITDDLSTMALRKNDTALIVLDMQYASACRTTGLGRWLHESGRSADGQYRFDRIETLVVPNLQKLLSVFRSENMPVIYVRIGAHMQGCRDLAPTFRHVEHIIGNYSGRREFDILDELAPRPGEPVVTKLSASAFNSSNIDQLLRFTGVSQLVFGGVSTSHCVDLTARDAADRGYDAVIVEDAVAEDTPELHEASLELFSRLFGRVEATEVLVSELLPKGTEAPRTVESRP